MKYNTPPLNPPSIWDQSNVGPERVNKLFWSSIKNIKLLEEGGSLQRTGRTDLQLTLTAIHRQRLTKREIII